MADQNGAQTIITADKARDALDAAAAQAVQTGNMDVYHKMVQSLIVTLYQRVDENQGALVQVGRAARYLAKEVAVLRGGSVTEAPTPAEGSEAPAPAVGTEPRATTASGEPLSAEDQAREAAMDAAIAAAEAEKGGAAPPARQMVARGRSGRPGPGVPQRRRPAGPAPQVTEGGDVTNLPEDPEARQAALNAIMDAASTEA